MEIKNHLVIVCLVCSLAGLILIYIADVNLQPIQMKIGEITFEMVGRKVVTSGYITYVRTHPEGHIFLTVGYGNDKIEVPLFSGFVSSLEGNGLSKTDFQKGKRIIVEGLVDEYQGSLQIVPRIPEDITLVD
jgi:DNA/RNA endonuclease YhcR with UshA esterase domain